MGRKLAVAADPGRDVSAEERRDRFAAARERDIVDSPGIDARRLGNQSGEDVIGATRRATAPGKSLGALPEHLDE